MTTPLRFDETRYQSAQVTIDGQVLRYRAFLGLDYVTMPVDAIQQLNVFVPESYFDNGQVNGYTRVTAPIFMPNTVGDVISKDPAVAPQLTPVAQFEGEYLAADTQDSIVYPVMATGSFTFPQIAQVGMPVVQAVGDSDYRIKRLALSPDFAYAGTNDEDAELVGVFDQQNRLVGASEVSQTATDDVNQLAGVIGSGQTVTDWRQQQLYIFPTLASKIKYFLA
ncbi:hypothetical protein [Levilactobacillus parabrevis]|uniref:hypothetical protein n=1 Tax=Levilactobacillus parabrevis TaxID=357278 RepID=UPI003756BB28